MKRNFLFSIGLSFLAISGIFCKLSTLPEKNILIPTISLISLLFGVSIIIRSEKNVIIDFYEKLTTIMITIAIPIVFYFTTEIIIK